MCTDCCSDRVYKCTNIYNIYTFTHVTLLMKSTHNLNNQNIQTSDIYFLFSLFRFSIGKYILMVLWVSYKYLCYLVLWENFARSIKYHKMKISNNKVKYGIWKKSFHLYIHPHRYNVFQMFIKTHHTTDCKKYTVHRTAPRNLPKSIRLIKLFLFHFTTVVTTSFSIKLRDVFSGNTITF